MHVILSLAEQSAEILAVQMPSPVPPPGSEDITNIAGWAMWVIALGLVVAFAWGVGSLAWSAIQGHRNEGGKHLIIVLLCAIGFGAGGQILTPLMG